MAISYRLVPEHSAVLMNASGAISLKDVMGYLSSLEADPCVPENHVTLFDASEVTEAEFSPSDIEKAIFKIRSLPPKIVARKLAIITRGIKETNLAHQYETLATSLNMNIIIFYHHDLACQWLGIPEDTLKSQ